MCFLLATPERELDNHALNIHMYKLILVREQTTVFFSRNMLNVAITSDEWMFFRSQLRNLHLARSSVHLQTALGKLAEMKKKKELERETFMNEEQEIKTFGYNSSPQQVR